MNRRDFMKKGMTVAAGAAVAGTGIASLLSLTGCKDKGPDKKIIGLQLYSLRDAMGSDVPGTLKKVSDIGYSTLETAGYGDGKLYGYAPAEFRKMCEDLGMKATSAHLGQAYTPDRDAEIMAWWDKALDDQVAAGCTYAVQPFVPIGSTLDEMRIQCDYFNRVGEMAGKKGLKFGFHNHAGEFATIEDQVIFDFMVENTTKDVVYQLDVFWVVEAGKDPVYYINKYKDRIPLLHIKDDCVIGESGRIDFESIFNAFYANGHKDYFVEVEKYTLPPENCVQRSFDFLMVSPFVK